MKLQDMTKEQLIEYVDAQKKQMQNLRYGKLPLEKSNTGLQAFYEELDFISSTSRVNLIVTDTDGTIMSFNKALQDLLGISIEEYRNRNVSGLYANPEERKHLLEILSKSGAVRNFEIKVKHKDGSLRTVLANADYIEMDDTHVLLTSLFDITQYKQKYELQRGSDGGYRNIFKNVPVGIIVTNERGAIILSNNAIHELVGYSAEELKNINVQDFYAIKSDRQQLLELTEEIGYVRDFETLYKRKDGREIPVLINMDKIEFREKKDILLTSVRDISNIKKIKDELTQERDFSNAILDTTASLIMVLDHDKRITRFNKTSEQISGSLFSEIKGTYLWDAPFLDPDVTKDDIKKLFSNKFPFYHDATWFSKDGGKYLIHWAITALPDNEGQTEYIIATGIDITEQKKIEEKLHEMNHELGIRIEELQERTEEMNQLNEMGGQLQSCQTMEEVCAISAQYIKGMCPFSNGALYLINKNTNMAEAVEAWGEPISTQKSFTSLACWAIRRGRKHLIDGNHHGLLCSHVTGPKEGQYLCVPLLINGEAIGILHLNRIPAQEGAEQQIISKCSSYERKIQVVETVAEHIGLALSNLQLKETLHQQSIRDALTGLFNRRYMEETLERELSRAKRENIFLGVFMLDIDHFKKFNDTAGHDAGDALLRELAGYLKNNSRGGDIVCRYGGEEFLVVLPGINNEDARLRAENLRKGIKDLSVYHLGAMLPKCTVSIGVALYPENGLTTEKLTKAADMALYQAKNTGRDKVVFAK